MHATALVEGPGIHRLRLIQRRAGVTAASHDVGVSPTALERRHRQITDDVLELDLAAPGDHLARRGETGGELKAEIGVEAEAKASARVFVALRAFCRPG